MTTIVVLGDSHVAALAEGARLLGADLDADLRFCPLGGGHLAPQQFFAVSEAGNGVRITIDGWNSVSFPLPDVDGDKTLYAVSIPSNSSRFLRDYDWATYVPWQFLQTGDEIPLSDAVIQHIVRGDTDNPINFVQALRDIGLNVCVIDAPRYFEHAPHVQSMRQDVCSYLSEHFLASVRNRLNALDIPLIEQPAFTIDERGGTLMKFRHPNLDDSHHANAQFGAVMVQSLLNYSIRI